MNLNYALYYLRTKKVHKKFIQSFKKCGEKNFCKIM